jgi:hypothetical protein
MTVTEWQEYLDRIDREWSTLSTRAVGMRIVKEHCPQSTLCDSAGKVDQTLEAKALDATLHQITRRQSHFTGFNGRGRPPKMTDEDIVGMFSEEAITARALGGNTLTKKVCRIECQAFLANKFKDFKPLRARDLETIWDVSAQFPSTLVRSTNHC